jgi:protease-4
MSSSRPFTEEERESLWEQIVRTYDVFLDRVMTCRKMTREAVDAVGGGRVWMGRQALEHGLIDELGGLDLAIRRAREQAGLGRRSKVVEVKAGKKLRAPAAAGASAWLGYALDGVRALRPGNVLAVCPLVPIEEEF